ncbi:MAG: transcription-repair coupling factor, partial [Myxococcales bacterium]|nr:transcription-repair coupling factor [Myxococcales bacterium]
DVGATRVDLLVVEYAGGDKLYLPVYRLNQIEKFAGGEGTPKLDRLGGQSFAKTKARARREVRQMADELLKLYAERRAIERPPLGQPDDDYRAFEATFPYEETVDQASAILEVERDLEKPSPMDRLVCGDVGFGKTEIAIRAAFRVASAGKQVAILCPTTVLAQQHFLGFSARMTGSPLEIRALSRFSEKAAQDETVRGLKAGKVDIVIGTHRLLSKDIHFKSLGLLVVDEEQRFGVAHKERIKQLKNHVDVLTLSATPIPRTLQMAVSGVRDMSLITTPPVDRRAIRTLVTRNDPLVLREAIQRELDRSGQVFYVYNRVEGLHERAARIQELLPGARIAVAHGQMSEIALERAMVDFVEGRYDVLCATAIIESGLDIPRANTIIIDRADMFGLAQLYQLRGRVGRSRERAYCYLVVPPQNEMSDDARSRIEAIERHTELGSGFQIASLDLELRGGGDLLGADQTGTVGAIGFEMFCRMLEEAVQELRGNEVVHDIDPELTVDEEALLPDDYVEDVGVRLSLYKRLACSESEAEVDEIASEMEDRFGAPPESARRLTRLMRLKTELRKLKVLGCEATARSVTLHFREDAPLDIQKLLALVQAKRSPFKLTPDMRLTRQIREADPAKGGLEAADLVLSEVSRCLRDDAA